MSVKFDGTYIKRGSTTIANMRKTDELREGQSTGGKCLGNIRKTDEIREGQSTGGKCLCNIRDGRYIREGQSTGGRQLIKIQDAAKAVGTSAQGPSTALVWWFLEDNFYK